MHVKRSILREFGQVIVQRAQRRVVCVFDVLAQVFAGLSHVEDSVGEVGIRSSELRCGNRMYGIYFLAGRLPSIDTALQIAKRVVEADARQTRHHFLLSAGGRDQDDVGVDVDDQFAYPRSEVAVDADEDAVGDVGCGELLRRTDIEHEGLRFICHGLKGGRGECAQPPVQHLVDVAVTFLVHFDIEREVAGRRQQAVGYLGDEFVACHVGAQRIIHGFLVAERVDRFFHHVFAASGTGAVSGIYDDIVREGHDFRAQAVERNTGQLFLGHGRSLLGQIGSSDVTEEERIAGEDGDVFATFIAQQIRGAFHGVAGRVKHLDRDVADAEFFSVRSDVRFKRRVGVGSVNDGGSGLFGKCDVAAHKIRMEVRFQHVLDFDTVFLGSLDVRGDFAQRIDDDAFAIAMDVVGALSQAARVDLFDFHDRLGIVSCELALNEKFHGKDESGHENDEITKTFFEFFTIDEIAEVNAGKDAGNGKRRELQQEGPMDGGGQCVA